MDPMDREKDFDISERYMALLEKLGPPYRIGGVPPKGELVLISNDEMFSPQPKTPQEAWDFITNVYAPVCLEQMKYDFEIYGSFKDRKEDVKMIVKDIEDFIEKANSISAKERERALTPGYPSNYIRTKKEEYYRIKNGNFYKRYKCELGLGSITTEVYSKYFLFYDFLKSILEEGTSNVPQRIEKKINTDQLRKNSSPYFKKEAVLQIYNILSGYFPEEQHNQLKLLLEKGEKPINPLTFRYTAIGLCDFFKQLLAYQFITIPVQADLAKWIIRNFKYANTSKSKGPDFLPISAKSAENVISGRDHRPAEGKRLIEIKEDGGKFIIIPLKIESRQKNSK